MSSRLGNTGEFITSLPMGVVCHGNTFLCIHAKISIFWKISLGNIAKSVARLAIARERIYMWQPLATAKQVTFLQNILWENYSKFSFKKSSLKKFLKILILKRKYIKTCFYSNQHPWAIKHSFISSHSKYQFLRFICLPVMNSPVFPSIDDIYCIQTNTNQQASIPQQN